MVKDKNPRKTDYDKKNPAKKDSEKEIKKTGEKIKIKTIKLTPGITLKDFANEVNRSTSSLIKFLLGKGKAISINQSLDIDTIEILAEELRLNIKLPSKKKEKLTFRRISTFSALLLASANLPGRFIGYSLLALQHKIRFTSATSYIDQIS